MVFSDSLWSALIKSSTLFEEKHERKPNQEDRFLTMVLYLRKEFSLNQY